MNIDYKEIKFEDILSLSTVDRNLYHYLCYKTLHFEDDKEVAVYVEGLLKAGINPEHKQAYAFQVDDNRRRQVLADITREKEENFIKKREFSAQISANYERKKDQNIEQSEDLGIHR